MPARGEGGSETRSPAARAPGRGSGSRGFSLQAARAKHPFRRLQSLWDFQNPGTSELRFRRALQGSSGPTNAVPRAEILTQIARAQGLQRRFQAAHRTLDRIEPHLPQLGPRLRILYSLERGRVLRSAGKPKSALPHFRRAWKIARRSGEDAFAVDAAHMVALGTSGAAQTSWNARALKLAERSRDPGARRWRGSLWNNIGRSDFERGKYRAALRSFTRAVRYRLRERDAAETRVAKWCVAKTLRVLGRTTEALRMQRSLLAAWRRAKGKDGYVVEELGECYWAKGRTREARPFFRRAVAELSRDPWLVAREPARLRRLRELAAGRPYHRGTP
jgi:tetratricopeptide (TPR) repeat protein